MRSQVKRSVFSQSRRYSHANSNSGRRCPHALRSAEANAAQRSAVPAANGNAASPELNTSFTQWRAPGATPNSCRCIDYGRPRQRHSPSGTAIARHVVAGAHRALLAFPAEEPRPGQPHRARRRGEQPGRRRSCRAGRAQRHAPSSGGRAALGGRRNCRNRLPSGGAAERRGRGASPAVLTYSQPGACSRSRLFGLKRGRRSRIPAPLTSAGGNALSSARAAPRSRESLGGEGRGPVGRRGPRCCIVFLGLRDEGLALLLWVTPKTESWRSARVYPCSQPADCAPPSP